LSKWEICHNSGDAYLNGCKWDELLQKRCVPVGKECREAKGFFEEKCLVLFFSVGERSKNL
jgi:hypothetical protein